MTKSIHLNQEVIKQKVCLEEKERVAGVGETESAKLLSLLQDFSVPLKVQQLLLPSQVY